MSSCGPTSTTRRANVVVFNCEKKPELDVDAGEFLKAGDPYRLLNPRDFFGKPVLTGTYDGKPIRVPMTGEFAAFVLMKAGGAGTGTMNHRPPSGRGGWPPLAALARSGGRAEDLPEF